ncbi:hypothetical protein [Pseudonocardia sp. EC080619-01]|uniref:hypothetical protein n=1 Tax=Pseudonocardia sp. EC080619-01 TaxID=1096856 RepID=UPI001874DCCB
MVSLTERRLTHLDTTMAALPTDQRPLPTVTVYDELLARRRDPDTAIPVPCPQAGEVS